MAKFMGFSNTEIGLIMSTFVLRPLFSMPLAALLPINFHMQNDYFRDDHYRITGSVNGNNPPLWVMLCIQVAFAITTILCCGRCRLKPHRCWAIIASKGNYGLDGRAARRRCNVAGGVSMWVFSRFAPDDSASLKTVILSIVWFTFCWAFCVGFLLAIQQPTQCQ